MRKIVVNSSKFNTFFFYFEMTISSMNTFAGRMVTIIKTYLVSAERKYIFCRSVYLVVFLFLFLSLSVPVFFSLRLCLFSSICLCVVCLSVPFSLSIYVFLFLSQCCESVPHWNSKIRQNATVQTKLLLFINIIEYMNKQTNWQT